MKKQSKDKILEAALDIFGQKGYKAATIREICRKAGVNIALVNYHFSSKKLLYHELLESIVAEVSDKYPVSDFVNDNMSRNEKLKGLVILMVNRAFGDQGIGRNKRRMQLIVREMIEPSEMLNETLIKRVVEVRERGLEIMREFMPDEKDEKIDIYVISLVSQCMFPMFASEMMKRVGFRKDSDSEFSAKLADYIYNSFLKLLEGGK